MIGFQQNQLFSGENVQFSNYLSRKITANREREHQYQGRREKSISRLKFY